MDEDKSTHGLKGPSAPTTICTLPNELLVQIFCLVCFPNLCTAWDNTNDTPKFSTALTLVCSRWRQLVKNMPVVLSHVDLLIHRSNDPKHLALARTYIARAKQVFLDIHIVHRIDKPAPSSLEDFCNILDLGSPRMRSLTFQQVYYSDYIAREVLSHCLGHAVPGVLEEINLVMDGRGGGRRFIKTKDSEISHSLIPIVINHTTSDRLEAMLLSVATLRLCGVFPYWTSNAYCGLVELCLHFRRDGSRTIAISQSSLWRILSSSPKLQILDLSINLTGLAESTAVPIHLDDLQVLRIGSMRRRQFGHFLKFLFPGSKPLTLCCRGYPDKDILTDDGIISFFGRASVERIWLHAVTFVSALQLLELAPDIRELALSQLSFSSRPSSFSPLPGAKVPDRIHSLGPIETLYLLPSCQIDIIALKYMMRSRIQKFLVHHECVLTVDDLPVPPSTLEKQLAGLYPDLELFYAEKPFDWKIPSFPSTI
ncbi:hypothetical protein ACGC1H_004114 [Rhizoctonia solani]